MSTSLTMPRDTYSRASRAVMGEVGTRYQLSIVSATGECIPSTKYCTMGGFCILIIYLHRTILISNTKHQTPNTNNNMNATWNDPRTSHQFFVVENTLQDVPETHQRRQRRQESRNRQSTRCRRRRCSPCSFPWRSRQPWFLCLLAGIFGRICRVVPPRDNKYKLAPMPAGLEMRIMNARIFIAATPTRLVKAWGNDAHAFQLHLSSPYFDSFFLISYEYRHGPVHS